MRMIDLFYAAQHGEEAYWSATAATAGSGITRYAITGNTATLRFAGRMVSFGTRAHINAVRAIWTTSLVRGGSVSLGGAVSLGLSAITLGYTSGAVIGTGISQILWGDEGAKAALDLYTSPTKFWNDGILGMGGNIKTIWNSFEF